ncbi:hypothetical protein Glove_661g23 [Diversispora epigaea]|uniref:Crinkler effector protein N-terminal domain-containing protein n=1 Tax=Diversispora epigaea TaxID=1348612 RepID=A0A397G3Y8_9GLOM|nr:hypothetical protein Glove_661g23 [Diversispora epigaea]
MNDNITLNCIINGEPYKNVFPVKINRNETIGELKKLIKSEKCEFVTFGASDLRIWKVDKQLDINLSANFVLQDVIELVAVKEVKHYWNPQHPIVKGNLHVGNIVTFAFQINNLLFSISKIVPRPTDITLNCRVSGYPSDAYYPIRISMNANFGELQSMIKKQWNPLFNHIVFDELKIMIIKESLNDPMYSESEKTVKTLDQINSVFNLRVKDGLRQYFSDLDNVENQLIDIYKQNERGSEGELLESDTMLEQNIWVIHAVNNTDIEELNNNNGSKLLKAGIT